MTPPAWRLALWAALAFLSQLPIQATEATGSPAPSVAAYSQGNSSSPSMAPTPSVSPSPTPSPSPITRPPTPDIDSLGRTLGYLTLFAALAGGAVYFLKFGLPLVRKGAKTDRRLHILETRPLGNRQYLLVVAYDDTRMLLGITPGKIDYLCPLDSSSTPPDFGKIMASAESKSTPS